MPNFSLSTFLLLVCFLILCVEDLLNLLTVNNEEDILQVFQSVNTRFKNPSKIPGSK